jgi:bifunctional non-homologous end joining protein LigD
MIVWDRGVWVALEDPVEGLEKGKLLFELRGYKLRGVWTLVKMKKTERDWLLIKERDGLVADPGDDWAEDSVLSGLTVEELASGRGRGAEISTEAKRLGAAKGAPYVSALEPMLAETADVPFSSADWVFELKYDGYRFLAGRDGADVRLQTRNGRDATATFPEVARALAALPYDRFVVDGEIVVHDDAGLPSFQRLQRRAGLSRSIDVRNAAVELPATMYLFDLLASTGNVCCACCCRRRARCATRTTLRSRARRCTSRSRGWGSRGSSRRRHCRATGAAGRATG